MRAFFSILTLLLLTTSFESKGQTMIRVGSDLTINASAFGTTPAIGIGFSYEAGLWKNKSIDFSCFGHFGTKPVQFEYWQRDYLIGANVEFKHFFYKKFETIYAGLKIGMDRIIIQNWFEPTPDDPVPTYVGWEFFPSLTCGTYINGNENNMVVNPFFSIGVDPFGLNEYEARIQFGVMLSRKPE